MAVCPARGSSSEPLARQDESLLPGVGVACRCGVGMISGVLVGVGVTVGVGGMGVAVGVLVGVGGIGVGVISNWCPPAQAGRRAMMSAIAARRACLG
ncbi:MAG: hypothetical protein U0841_11390 [Chloroflexia bacterium]